MEKMYGRRLLLIGCSNRESKIDRRVAAWDLYDGVVFRTLKKLQADGYLDGNVDIRILSAQYGNFTIDRDCYLQPANDINSCEAAFRSQRRDPARVVDYSTLPGSYDLYGTILH